MKVNVLGFWGTFPSAGGATSSYLITGNSGQILLDCGSGVMSKLPFYTNVENISAVILTHLHFDHMSDVGILQYSANFARRTNIMKTKLNIYAPSEPKEIFNTINGENVNLYTIDSIDTLNITDMKITFTPVNHTIPCYAVKIEEKGKKVVYITDTVYMDSLGDFANNADLLICGTAISSESRHTTGKGHMNADEAGKIAKKGNVKKLLLSHISHDCDILKLQKDASDSFGGPVYLPHNKTEFII